VQMTEEYKKMLSGLIRQLNGFILFYFFQRELIIEKIIKLVGHGIKKWQYE